MLKSLLSLLQSSPSVQQSLSKRHESSGSVDPILESVRQCLRSSPKYQQAVEQLSSEGVQECASDEAAAARFKAQGSSAFKAGHLQQAAELYTETLRWQEALSTGGLQEAARLHSNRSLCLAKMEPPHAAAAEADATCALRRDSTFLKAFHRRAVARLQQGNVAGARSDCHAGIALATTPAAAAGDGPPGSSHLTQKPLLPAAARAALSAGAADLRLLLSQLPSPAEAPPCSDADTSSAPSTPSATSAAQLQHQAPSFSTTQPLAQPGGTGSGGGGGGARGDLPPWCAAAAAGLVAAGRSARRGQHLLAAAHIAAGTDLFRELPAACVLTRPRREAHCWRCCGTLPALYFPCQGCPQARYCSPACQEAEGDHRPGGAECGVPWPTLLPAEALLACRLAARYTGQGVAPLLDHGAELDDEALLHRALLAHLTAAVHHAVDAQRRYSAAPPGAPRTATAGVDPAAAAGGGGGAAVVSPAHVFCWLGRIAVNGVAVVPLRSGSAAGRLGLGLYPWAAHLNHSCAPNVSFRFEGHCLVVRCCRDVSPGEELVVSYGPQQGEAPTAARRALLQAQYAFACSCGACERVQPLDGPAPASSSHGATAVAAAVAGAVHLDRAHGALRCFSTPSCDGAVVPREAPLAELAALQAMLGDGACDRCGASLLEAQAKEAERCLEAGATSCREAEERVARAEEALDHLLSGQSRRGAPGCSSSSSSSSGGSSVVNDLRRPRNGNGSGGDAAPSQGDRMAAEGALEDALAALAMFESGVGLLAQALHPLNMMLGMACHGAGRAALAAVRAARCMSAAAPPCAAAGVVREGVTAVGGAPAAAQGGMGLQGNAASSATPAPALPPLLPAKVQQAVDRGVMHFRRSLHILDAQYPAGAPAPAFERLELCQLLRLASPAPAATTTAAAAVVAAVATPPGCAAVASGPPGKGEDAVEGPECEGGSNGEQGDLEEAAALQALRMHFGDAVDGLVS